MDESSTGRHTLVKMTNIRQKGMIKGTIFHLVEETDA